MSRLAVANEVLASFTIVQIERRPTGYFVCWENHGGKKVAKRWMCRGQDFYPVWSRKYPHGGTSSTALAQLIRWVRGQPVLPIETWRYWSGDTIKLCSPEVVDKLLAGGYPEFADCVLCHERIEGGLDWWSLDGVTGPCCGWSHGCKQQK